MLWAVDEQNFFFKKDVGAIRCDLGIELLSDSADLLLLNGPFKNRVDVFPLLSSNRIEPRAPLQKPIE